MDINVIYTKKELEALQNRAQKINSDRLQKRKKISQQKEQIRKLVDAIQIAIDSVKLYGEVLNSIYISRADGKTMIQLNTDRKSNYENTSVTGRLKNIIGNSDWDCEVWDTVCDIFSLFPNYEANYAIEPKGSDKRHFVTIRLGNGEE